MGRLETAALFATAVRNQQAGRLAEAEAGYREILGADPDHAHSLHYLGVLAFQTGRTALAAELIAQSIAVNDAAPDAHCHLGAVLRALGRPDEAAISHRRALALAPDYAEAHYNLGNALVDLGRLDEAVACYYRAVELKPDYAEAYNRLGNVLADKGKLDLAEAAYRRPALELGYAEASYNLGNLLQGQGRLDEATESYRRAIACDPSHAMAHNNLGNALTAQGRLEEAMAAFRTAILLKPAYALAFNNLGAALRSNGDLDEAEAAYRRALAIEPGYAEAHFNLGSVLADQRKFDKAIDSYRAALAIKPDYAEALAELVYVSRCMCDWSRSDEDESRLLDLLRTDRARVSPFIILNLRATPADQLRCAERWVEGLAVPPGARLTAATSGLAARRGGKIRLGYLSADFHRHATAYLTAELFERHDRSHFEVVAYSFGPDDGSSMRRRLVAAFDRFVDIRDSAHAVAARLIKADEIDILIDLKGFTRGARTPILAYRPAPVQVSFLGYPGTMGTDFIDYAIVDPFLVPPGQTAFYREKLAWLPDCYQPNDSHRDIADTMLSRARCGLPEKGFVFCCFNNSYKITSDQFDIWARLLAAVPHSTLWLLEDNGWAAGNLRREAEARGVAPERLVFAPRLPLAEHLARHRLADLFLDTLPYNAHTTASDALWTGLPVLTCAGNSFAGRVAGSLLRAVGLSELIATSTEQYERLALALAQDPVRLAALSERLQANRATAALFDIGRYTKALEAAFVRMWRIKTAGDGPKSFTIQQGCLS